MARAIWSGAINFGLVTVPVGLYSATDDHTVHFHQFERGTSDRVRNQRVNERTGKEVDYDDVVKGREVGDGDLVQIEPDELEEIAPGRSQTIDINGFVELEKIDPIFFQKTYYVAPQSEEYGRTYDLLLQALESSERAGIALFVMRGKQYLTALRPSGRVLMLQTMYFADEIRDPKKELDNLPSRRKFKGKEIDTAVQLIEAMSIDWKPGSYKDTYTERVQKMIRDKTRGKEVVAEEDAPEATNVVDLMDALQRSVEDSKKSRSRSRSGSKSSSKSAPKSSSKSSSKSAPKSASAKKSSPRKKTTKSTAKKASRSGRKAS